MFWITCLWVKGVGGINRGWRSCAIFPEANASLGRDIGVMGTRWLNLWEKMWHEFKITFDWIYFRMSMDVRLSWMFPWNTLGWMDQSWLPYWEIAGYWPWWQCYIAGEFVCFAQMWQVLIKNRPKWRSGVIKYGMNGVERCHNCASRSGVLYQYDYLTLYGIVFIIIYCKSPVFLIMAAGDYVTVSCLVRMWPNMAFWVEVLN